MIDQRWREARRILAVRLDNLGDVLLTTPALHALKTALPDAELTLLTSPVGTQAGRLNPDVSRVITYDAPWVDPWQRLPHDSAREQAMITSLRAGRYDAAVIFTSYRQSPLPAAYACYLADVPLRLAASIDGPGSLLTTRHKHPGRMMHEVERGLDLVGAVGVPPAELDLVLGVPECARSRIASWTEDFHRPLVVVHPGCSMPARTYPWEQCVEVVERLIDRIGARVILTGSTDEADLVGRIFDRLCPAARRDTTCAAGVLPFPEFCALIEAADVVITNNTGPMHIAAAVKTPVVVLFALTNPPEQWHPWRVEHRLLYHDVPCRLCYSRVCPVGHECLRLVTADQVVTAAEDLLATSPKPRRRSKTSNSRPSLVVGGAAPTTIARAPKIAVLRSLFLGDLLCATPALRALRSRFPQAEITLMGLPWARELVDRLPSIDRFEQFPGFPGLSEVAYEPSRTREFVERARRQRYDLIVQMHGCGPASNEFVAALGGAMSLGFSRDAVDRLTIELPWREDEHEVLRWLRLLGALGGETSDAHLDFPLRPRDFLNADTLLGKATASGRTLVGLHAGAKDPARRWPVDRFASFADRLGREFDCRFVLTGTAAERRFLNELASAMAVPAVNLAGRTDLGALAAVIARLDLLVTNDTGASHVAAVVRTPSVILFGPTSPARWAPLNRRLHRPLDARALTGELGDGAAALAALKVEPVFAACCEQLAMDKATAGTFSFDASPSDSALEVVCRD
jgi:ADP-heptose:LPS heptosyltransferase